MAGLDAGASLRSRVSSSSALDQSPRTSRALISSNFWFTLSASGGRATAAAAAAPPDAAGAAELEPEAEEDEDPEDDEDALLPLLPLLPLPLLAPALLLPTPAATAAATAADTEPEVVLTPPD